MEIGLEWKPIYTAPKDGTDVLVYARDSYAVARWNGEEWRDMGDIGWAGMYGDDGNQPTHWMPLPAKPSKKNVVLPQLLLYGLEAAQWLARCADHGNAMSLIFARTETRMFFDHVWPKAQGVLFLEGRLYFHHVCGRRASANAGAPSVLVAYGSANAECLKSCTLAGRYVAL